jgi:MoaA/NifB/PqqE/SkfB family radical SAM enzyme
LYIPKSPIMLCIGLTTKCNLNCRHCSADANSENVFFPHSELITIIDTAKELGVKKLIFGGGEPLLYEQLFVNDFKRIFVNNPLKTLSHISCFQLFKMHHKNIFS